jgi:hypothetical protein
MSRSGLSFAIDIADQQLWGKTVAKALVFNSLLPSHSWAGSCKLSSGINNRRFQGVRISMHYSKGGCNLNYHDIVKVVRPVLLRCYV